MVYCMNAKSGVFSKTTPKSRPFPHYTTLNLNKIVKLVIKKVIYMYMYIPNESVIIEEDNVDEERILFPMVWHDLNSS